MVSDPHPYDQLIDDLKQVGIIFAEGLSNEQFTSIEMFGGFQFPPDLKAFLELGVPIGQKRIAYDGEEYIEDRFPNWHQEPEAILRKTRHWLLRTFYFDVVCNGFWMTPWGQQPSQIRDALKIVRQHVQAGPKMIPIFAHRHLPATPCLAGNPVFSIWQAIDTIHYGYDLESYLRNEFIRSSDKRVWGTDDDYRDIPLWTDIVYGRNRIIKKREDRT